MESAPVYITYHLFYLVDAEDETVAMPNDFQESNGLICPLATGAVVITGTDMGFVTVGVDVLAAEPELSMKGWDEGADVSVYAPQGKLNAGSMESGPPGLPELSAHGPGCYRIRCLARNRLAEFNSIGSELNSEEFLLQCWPAPWAPEKVHKIQWHLARNAPPAG